MQFVEVSKVARQKLTNDFELPVTRTNNAVDILSDGTALGSNPENTVSNMLMVFFFLEHIGLGYTRSVRKVSDRIFLCEHLMDYNLARLHEPTLNLSAHA